MCIRDRSWLVVFDVTGLQLALTSVSNELRGNRCQRLTLSPALSISNVENECKQTLDNTCIFGLNILNIIDIL